MQPAPEEVNSVDRELQSLEVPASNAWFVRGLRTLDAGLPLLIVLHISSIAWAVQDRRQFERVLGQEGERLGWAAAAIAAGWLARAVLHERARGGQFPSRGQFPRLLGWSNLGLWLLHALGLGLGQATWNVTEYDAWCAVMSSTWYSLPLCAFAHLVGVGLSAIDAKHSLGRIGSGSNAAPRRAPVLVWQLAAWAAALWIAGAGASVVFALATGSGAIF